MHYIVMDFEFNQAFAFKNGLRTYVNEKCPFEIIQIGAIKLDDTFQIVDRFSSYIRPQIYKRLHPYVENLTEIDENDLNQCHAFYYNFEAFCKFAGDEELVLCTWGRDDLKILYQNIRFFKIETKLFDYKYIDIQKYAGIFLNNDNDRCIGLKNAVHALNIPPHGKFHDAYYDAYYTAQVFQNIKPGRIEPENMDMKRLRRIKRKRPARTLSYR